MKNKLIEYHLNIIRDEKYPCGLYPATTKKSKTGYEKVWIRDNLYLALAFWESDNHDEAREITDGIFKILLKNEYKIDYAIKEKPKHTHQYIHARYTKYLKEIHEEWGHKQNDAIGLFLFCIAKFYNEFLDDKGRIVCKLIDYLYSIQFWKEKDNGMWEEVEKINISSIVACIEGLKSLEKMVHPRYYQKISDMISLGNKRIIKELSKDYNADLSLLSLIYPFDYNLSNKDKRWLLMKTKSLKRKNGLARYWDDKYFELNNNEAEWTMGFPWLAIIYKDNLKKYNKYINKTFKVMRAGKLPELYYGKTNSSNMNEPLLWSHAMLVIALTK